MLISKLQFAHFYFKLIKFEVNHILIYVNANTNPY